MIEWRLQAGRHLLAASVQRAAVGVSTYSPSRTTRRVLTLTLTACVPDKVARHQASTSLQQQRVCVWGRWREAWCTGVGMRWSDAPKPTQHARESAPKSSFPPFQAPIPTISSLKFTAALGMLNITLLLMRAAEDVAAK